MTPCILGRIHLRRWWNSSWSSFRVLCLGGHLRNTVKTTSSLRSKMTIVTHLENLPLQKVAGLFLLVLVWHPKRGLRVVFKTGNEGEVARMQSKKSDLTNMKVGSYSRRKDALGDLCDNFLVALKWTEAYHMHFFQRHSRWFCIDIIHHWPGGIWPYHPQLLIASE